MGLKTDYYKDREEITPEKAHAKLGKEVMTPADYVPLVREYQEMWVDERTIRGRVQRICENSNGLLKLEYFKSGSNGAYKFEPAYNELLLTLVATECFDKRKNDLRVATQIVIDDQLLKNIERLPNKMQETIKQHPSYLNTKVGCKFMERIASEMAASIGVIGSANSVVQCNLMFQFLEMLLEFRRWAQQEDALSAADRLIDSHSSYSPNESNYTAKQRAFEAERLDDFIICLIALKLAGEEFQYVSLDEALPMSALSLAKRMFRLSLPLDMEEKLQNFENRIFNETRYKEIVGGMKDILDLDDKREANIYEKFIQILQIEYLRPQVTPGDYKKMIRFTENSMINQKRDKLRELEEMEQKMQQANNDLQEFTELTEV